MPIAKTTRNPALIAIHPIGRTRRIPRLLVALAAGMTSITVAAGSPLASASDVEPVFDLADPAGSPFPSDRYTTPDANQLTGRRVNLPTPDCADRPSDCQDIALVNTLDGFNLQPRLSLSFTGPIDLTTVTSDTLFLFKPGAAPRFVGINQVVWDPQTRTLYAEADEVLVQHSRYLFVVTDGVLDTVGHPIRSAQFRKFLNFGQTNNQAAKTYRTDLLAALDELEAAGVPPGRVAAASLFTTQSVTAVLEKIRDQLAAVTPNPVDFVLGSSGERTVFPLADVVSVTARRHDTTAPEFATTNFRVGDLRMVPGAVGMIAFGRYRSPRYDTTAGVIPPVATLTGVPVVQSTDDVYFNLVLPAGTPPAGGWPVVIGGHGAAQNGKNGVIPISVAANLAEQGLATITINAVGFGGGPLGTITVASVNGSTVHLLNGGRNVDRDNNGHYDQPGGFVPEGFHTSLDGPLAIVFIRDALRQTVIDLMQLVRQIQTGIDVDGDSHADLDASRVYYLGTSVGGMYGTSFTAIEPALRAAVLNVTGGPIVEVLRLAPAGISRDYLGQLLTARTPNLANGGPDPIRPTNPFPFRDNLPPRNQPPLINTIDGAIAIQDVVDRIEWVMQSGDAVAYARHLRQAPLPGIPTKRVLVTFTQGDRVIPNVTTAAILRAGELADRTTYFRAFDAYAPNTPNPTDLHESMFQFTPLGTPFALASQQAVATFLASDGQTTIDPDGDSGTNFETPINPPLPGEAP